MKPILLSSIFFLCVNAYSQHINKDDHSYMNVNHDRKGQLINWDEAGPLGELLERESWYGILFASGSIPDSAAIFDIRFDLKDISPKLSRSVQKLNLFHLDTANLKNERSYLFYANNRYFDSLNYINAVHLGVEEEKVGRITKDLLARVSAQDLCSILIHFDVIGTYHHLYSEIITTKLIETKSQFEINYFVEYHLCTNHCYDPTYEFGIKINKETGDVFAFGLK